MSKIIKGSKEYEAKLFTLALLSDVKRDVVIEIVGHTSKLKAYCEEVDAYCQFPKALRVRGRKFKADISCSKDDLNAENKRVFWRAVKESIERIR